LNFRGPGCIHCPIVDIENDDGGGGGGGCDSFYVDASCPTISLCDFTQEYIPTTYYTNANDDDNDNVQSITTMMIIPLICDCFVVLGCPSSCIYVPAENECTISIDRYDDYNDYQE
jgi:hypothetical protein